MKLAVNMPRHATAAETAEWARTMESIGVDVIWVGEAYSFDSVSMLGYLAGQTSTVTFGTSILQIFSRTAPVIGMTAAGLDFVSSGRVLLGLGASGPSVVEGWHGVPYEQPIARTRDVIEVCRKVWSRDRVEHRGQTLGIPYRRDGAADDSIRPLRLIDHPVRERIPVYLAALGNRNVALAAEIAEGWLPLFFDPDRSGIWSDAVADGSTRRDDALGPLEIVAGGAAAICDEPLATEIRDRERGHVALYVGGMGPVGRNFYNDLFVRYGFEDEAREIQRLFLSGERAAAQAAVPSEYLRSTALVGESGWVRDRIRAYAAAGVTCLNIEIPDGYDDPAGLVENLRKWSDE